MLQASPSFYSQSAAHHFCFYGCWIKHRPLVSVKVPFIEWIFRAESSGGADRALPDSVHWLLYNLRWKRFLSERWPIDLCVSVWAVDEPEFWYSWVFTLFCCFLRIFIHQTMLLSMKNCWLNDGWRVVMWEKPTAPCTSLPCVSVFT